MVVGTRARSRGGRCDIESSFPEGMYGISTLAGWRMNKAGSAALAIYVGNPNLDPRTKNGAPLTMSCTPLSYAE